MSVTLSPIAPRYAVSDADDPFKKYWWAILAGFAFTGMWLLMPMMGEKAVGSTSIDTTTPKADPNVEQSMGAEESGGINLSMEGTGHARKEDGNLGSSLFLAPDEAPAAGAAATAGLGTSKGGSTGSSTSLASALKKVSEKADGGWGEKAQKAFNAPKLGSGLSGMGSASGGSAASASAGGTGAFGSKGPNVGYGSARGLSGNVADVEAPKGGMAVLTAAANQSQAAARDISNDGARSAMSLAFDGAKGGNKIGGKGGASIGGNYAALDAAPANLKDADPKMNNKKIEAPPSTDMGDSKYKGNDPDLAKQIGMQVIGGVVGGVIGGPFGGIITNAVMNALQKQMDQQDKVHEMEEKIEMDRARRRIGLPPTGK